MTVVASVLLGFSAALTYLKVVSFIWETCWFALRANQVLLPSYREFPLRTNRLDIETGRPRLFDSHLEHPDSGRLGVTWSAVFKAPVVMLIQLIVVACFAGFAPDGILVASALGSAALGVLVVLAPVVSRLTLGPYDVLNPDLRVAPRIAPRMYRGERSSIALYMLVLLAFTIGSFTITYTALGSVPGAIVPNDGSSSNPISWLFSAVSISATEGLGHVAPQSPWTELVVVAQMATGPLVLAWVASSYFGERLPTDVEERLREEISRAAGPVSTGLTEPQEGV